MNHAALALLASAGLLLAGCTTGPSPDFDGQAAYDFVEGLVTDPDGGPRYRVPGTPGHAEAADWLWDQMAHPGWERSWRNVTGEEYEALDKGAVAVYAEEGRCPGEDREQVGNLTFHNLVAVKRASPPSDRLFLMGAHWESKEEANHDRDRNKAKQPVLGANDGASGVGVLLQLMRELDDVDLTFDVGVIFFDGEDGFEDCHPLAGSIAYAAQLEPGEVDRFLLLDMVGDPDARYIKEQRGVLSDPELVDLIWKHGHRLGGAKNFIDKTSSVADDHVPFFERGIPAVDVIDYGRGERQQGFPPYWHTSQDTMVNLSPAMLGLVGATVMATIQDPAFEASLVAGTA
ncbi:MAG: M28 family peptidase [Thermoplasmatota archaeon]